jgi:hypothetical protein
MVVSERLSSFALSPPRVCSRLTLATSSRHITWHFDAALSTFIPHIRSSTLTKSTFSTTNFHTQHSKQVSTMKLKLKQSTPPIPFETKCLIFLFVTIVIIGAALLADYQDLILEEHQRVPAQKVPKSGVRDDVVKEVRCDEVRTESVTGVCWC